MNTNTIIGLVVAVIVVGAGAWYFTTHPGGVPSGTETAAGSPDSGTGTFAALMALGGSKKCDVQVNTPESPATGTVYVSGGNVRSDTVVKPASMNGGSVSAHMIKTGDYIYSWTDMVPQGVKIKVDAAASAKGASQGGYDANAQVSYSCSAWIADASKFEVPSAITFMDFSAGASGAMPIQGGTMPTPPAGTPNPY